METIILNYNSDALVRQVCELLRTFLWIRKIIKLENNIQVFVFGKPHAKFDLFERNFCKLCRMEEKIIQDSESIMWGLSKLLKQLIVKEETDLIEPPFKVYPAITQLSDLVGLPFDASYFVLNLVYNYNSRKVHNPYLQCEAESVANLCQRDMEFISLFFPKPKSWMVKLSVLVGYSLRKIVEKYGNLQNWSVVYSLQDFEEKLKDYFPHLLLHL